MGEEDLGSTGISLSASCVSKGTSKEESISATDKSGNDKEAGRFLKWDDEVLLTVLDSKVGGTHWAFLFSPDAESFPRVDVGLDRGYNFDFMLEPLLEGVRLGMTFGDGKKVVAEGGWWRTIEEGGEGEVKRGGEGTLEGGGEVVRLGREGKGGIG